MDATQTFPYRFNRFEPALFVEIYLPKKIRYQGVLYESLRKGFDFENVKNHLKKLDNFVQISEFLEDYEELYKIYKKGDIKEIEDRVDKIQQSFYGYSMYEVDGVFFNQTAFDKRQNRNEKINKFIAEENVQVIRMIFMPDSKKILNDLNINREKDRLEFYEMRGFLKRVLQNQYECESEIEQEKKAISKDITRLEKREAIYKKVSDWINDVALFLFGFVIYKICQEIKELQKQDEKLEDEIWVTTFGNLEINRITRRE
jgi:hypothetical protein